MIVLIAVYWGWFVLSDWLELTTFPRFITRTLAGLLLLLIFVGWWCANRRIPWRTRLVGFLAFVVGGVVANIFGDRSVSGFALLTGPGCMLITAWALWLVLARGMRPGVQQAGLVAVICLAWAFLSLVRMDGLSGDLRPSVRWRWEPDALDAFAVFHANNKSQGEGLPALPREIALLPGDWPGYRGPNRDSTVAGVKIRADWDKSPPKLVWRTPVGPAWSSLIIVGGCAFTQEQRGENEAVVCYGANTGKELWSHEDKIHFYENVGGHGPRATPCFSQGRIYALGATGILNCLEAATGKPVWSRDVKTVSHAAVPLWAFSGAPLALGANVIVYAWGDSDSSPSLIAYKAETGEIAWSAPVGQASYSAPQPAVVGGKLQILQLTNKGLVAVDPVTGAILWEHPVPVNPGSPRSVQPTIFGDKNVLIASEADLGLAMVDVKYEGADWSASERWVSKNLRPSFNDFVVLDGHAYGFDGRFFACIDLATGKRRWKEGRYGYGQVLLLPDQKLLIVIAEDGNLILLRADPARSEELGRVTEAIKGKTWNHPVLAHGRLYIRNYEEMVCYEVGEVQPASK
jgi:outer membrane protein assembly factor BamB